MENNNYQLEPIQMSMENFVFLNILFEHWGWASLAKASSVSKLWNYTAGLWLPEDYFKLEIFDSRRLGSVSSKVLNQFWGKLNFDILKELRFYVQPVSYQFFANLHTLLVVEWIEVDGGIVDDGLSQTDSPNWTAYSDSFRTFRSIKHINIGFMPQVNQTLYMLLRNMGNQQLPLLKFVHAHLTIEDIRFFAENCHEFYPNLETFYAVIDGAEEYFCDFNVMKISLLLEAKSLPLKALGFQINLHEIYYKYKMCDKICGKLVVELLEEIKTKRQGKVTVYFRVTGMTPKQNQVFETMMADLESEYNFVYANRRRWPMQ